MPPAVGDDGRRPPRHLLQRLHKGLAAGHAVDPVIRGGHGPFHGQNVLPPILLNRFLQMMFKRLPASRREKMIVLQGDIRQYQIRRQRCRRADERFIAPGTFVTVQPDHHRQRLRLRRLHHLRQHIRTQSHQRRERHAAFQKTPSAQPPATIRLPHAFPFLHIKTPFLSYIHS